MMSTLCPKTLVMSEQPTKWGGGRIRFMTVRNGAVSGGQVGDAGGQERVLVSCEEDAYGDSDPCA